VDPWDNSMRLRDLGVALEINEYDLLTEKIKNKLASLLSDDQIRFNTHRMANHEDDYKGVERGVEYLLDY